MEFAVTPREAQTIAERVKIFNQETEILERLVRLERQNRRLTIIGSIFCALLAMFMVVAAFVLRQANTLDRLSLSQAAQGLLSDNSVDKDFPPSETATKPSEAKTLAVQEAPSPTEAPVTAATQAQKPTAPPPLAQDASTPKEPVAPTIKYVGSITSNKYHYPDCKWAKKIIPRKVRGFTSVAEAKKAGYIRCRTCKPPLADETDSHATVKK